MRRTHCRRWGLAVAAAALAIPPLSCIDLLPQPLPAQNDDGSVVPFDHLLRIARHAEQPLSENRVDNILSIAGGLLFSVDTECPDVFSPTTFTRNGSVETFTAGDNIVTNDKQLNAIFDVDADVKVVSLMVGVCGAPAVGDPAVVLGCAATGGSVTIAHDAPPDVWAHEWGHVQGLPHRDDCSRNLMHAFELETNAVNETERNALLTPTPGSSFRQISDEPPAGASALSAPLPGETIAECVARCVARRYLRGIPADALAQVDVSARVDALLDRLAAAPPEFERANIVRMLGVAGEPRACAAILAQLSHVGDELSADGFAACAESLLALGRLAAADESGAALGFLIAGTSGDEWADGAPRLHHADGSTTRVDAALARICVLALGISNHPESAAHLQLMRAGIGAGRSTDPWMAAQVDEAIARTDGAFARMREARRHVVQP